MKTKRDIIFVLVMALIVASLSFILILTLLGTVNGGLWMDWVRWGRVFAILVAIAGSLWLMRAYRRGRRASKMENSGGGILHEGEKNKGEGK